MNTTAIDNNTLKTLKVLVYSNDKFLEDRELIRKLLRKDRMISYNNEIMSIALYKEYIVNTINKSKLTYVSIIVYIA